MSDTTEHATPTPPPARPPRKPGRPKGAKTNPQIAAATRARKAGPRPPADPQPAATPPDDLAAQLAAAAVPAERANPAGRPSTDDKVRRTLAQQLATSYEGFGKMIEIAGSVLVGINPAVGQRLIDVGRELVNCSERCGLALARFAQTNPRVMEWVTRVASGGGLMLLVLAHAPILAAVAGRADLAPIAGLGADVLGGEAAGPDPLATVAAMFGPAFMQSFTAEPAPTA
jgi:hypothetical protein